MTAGMAAFVSLDQVRATREELGAGRGVWRTFFLNPPPGSREPQAFLIDYAPGFALSTHFHDVDEYQVVMAGDGTLGDHAIAPYAVHHARAWTPYGPIVAGAQGLSFLTLRARRDSAGPRKLPQSLPDLEAVEERRPWQAAEAIALPPADGAVTTQPLRQIVDAEGALGAVVALPPDSIHDALPGGAGLGAFVVLLRGSLRVPAGVCGAPAVAFVPFAENGVRLASGTDGAAALVLRFREHLAPRRG